MLGLAPAVGLEPGGADFGAALGGPLLGEIQPGAFDARPDDPAVVGSGGLDLILERAEPDTLTFVLESGIPTAALRLAPDAFESGARPA